MNVDRRGLSKTARVLVGLVVVVVLSIAGLYFYVDYAVSHSGTMDPVEVLEVADRILPGQVPDNYRPFFASNLFGSSSAWFGDETTEVLLIMSQWGTDVAAAVESTKAADDGPDPVAMGSFVKIGEEVIRVAGVDVKFELQLQMGTQELGHYGHRRPVETGPRAEDGSVQLVGVIERVNGSAVVLAFIGPSDDGIDRVGMRKFLDSIPLAVIARPAGR